MNIIVFTGSGHKKGTSALLADRFVDGAKSARHEVFRFDAALEDLHPCIACERCRSKGICFHNDSFDKIVSQVQKADLMVFVTPIYFFSMTAQLKMVIDRFHQIGNPMRGRKKVMLMATAWDNHNSVMQPLVEQFKAMSSYMEWEDIGMLLALGAGTRAMIEQSCYPEQAYQLGSNLK